MNIPLHTFLNLISYNGLFHYIAISSDIGKCIETADDYNKDLCYVEHNNQDYCTVWYPTSEWNEEVKRRSQLQRHVDVKVSPHVQSKKEIEEEILAAAMSLDKEKMKQLINKMELLYGKQN